MYSLEAHCVCPVLTVYVTRNNRTVLFDKDRQTQVPDFLVCISTFIILDVHHITKGRFR